MSTMTSGYVSEIGDRAYTVRDLESTPDDGRRYELLDGVLYVSPAPGSAHQRAVLRLTVLLDGTCPTELQVLSAPFGVQPSTTTELQPDVLVARDADITEKNLPTAPLLAVEVRSPSTALFDLNTKKAAYERMGVESYWIVDPVEPALTVFELDTSGRYELVAEVRAGESFEARRPFEVAVVPEQLVRRGGSREVSPG